jgi:very-short-patch-repair endonuclease
MYAKNARSDALNVQIAGFFRYRRDRRKDSLLQENGYFVLRFLSEDVGKHLDDVLDAILRTLVHRAKVIQS